jgi:hypothetical protein
MKIDGKFNDILKNQFGWIEIPIELTDWHYKVSQKVIEIVMKHPTKKLFFYCGTFGQQYRVYRKCQIDITHIYYTCKFNAEYNLDINTGILSIDDIIGINLK